jgi:hypothetical protein
MATESFFIHIKLTKEDEEVAEKFLNDLENENVHYFISEDKIQEVRRLEEEGKQAILKWLQNT